jgi:hypothetical protein
MWDAAGKSRRYRNREMIEAECDYIAAAKRSEALRENQRLTSSEFRTTFEYTHEGANLGQARPAISKLLRHVIA